MRDDTCYLVKKRSYTNFRNIRPSPKKLVPTLLSPFGYKVEYYTKDIKREYYHLLLDTNEYYLYCFFVVRHIKIHNLVRASKIETT